MVMPAWGANGELAQGIGSALADLQATGPNSPIESATSEHVAYGSVTIVVLNFNYARFVGQAIESALAQTHPECEVVVVDNGSTDNSLAVIEPYLDRVQLVRQAANIGQGQGYNLGIAAARGEWILWLDADDLLDPQAIETCLALADPIASKVQFSLRHINGEGQRVEGVVPHINHSGDVVPLIRRFGHYAGPPGSGNLYRRSAVAPYFPVRPQEWPICTDGLPFLVAPFHGKVVDAGRCLGSYRLHRATADAKPGSKGNYTDSVAVEIRLLRSAREHTFQLLRDHAGIELAAPELELPVHVRSRIISWRWAPDSHPYPHDTGWQLWRMMSRSLRECPGYPASERLAMLAWAAAVTLLPRQLATRVLTSPLLKQVQASMARLAHRSDP
jgi:hypothetical protein